MSLRSGEGDGKAASGSRADSSAPGARHLERAPRWCGKHARKPSLHIDARRMCVHARRPRRAASKRVATGMAPWRRRLVLPDCLEKRQAADCVLAVAPRNPNSMAAHVWRQVRPPNLPHHRQLRVGIRWCCSLLRRKYLGVRAP